MTGVKRWPMLASMATERQAGMSGNGNWVTCVTHAAMFPAGWEDGHRAGPLGEQNTTGACEFSYPPVPVRTGYYTLPPDASRDGEADGLHQLAAREMHAAGLDHDVSACGYPHSGVRAMVTRESGFVAASNFTDTYSALVFARECSEQVPGNPARVTVWDDSVWDDVPGVTS